MDFRLCGVADGCFYIFFFCLFFLTNEFTHPLTQAVFVFSHLLPYTVSRFLSHSLSLSRSLSPPEQNSPFQSIFTFPQNSTNVAALGFPWLLDLPSIGRANQTPTIPGRATAIRHSVSSPILPLFLYPRSLYVLFSISVFSSLFPNGMEMHQNFHPTLLFFFLSDYSRVSLGYFQSKRNRIWTQIDSKKTLHGSHPVHFPISSTGLFRFRVFIF
jgi:hypothetical protein